MFKVFYSWQSDLPGNTNRNLIQGALDKACRSLKSEEGVIAEAVVDRDTRGMAGAPSISDAIFSKIRDADAFVADVSLVNTAAHVAAEQSEVLLRATPNPNVLLELGYAMAQLGNEAIVLIVNQHYGDVEALPFPKPVFLSASLRAEPVPEEGACGAPHAG